MDIFKNIKDTLKHVIPYQKKEPEVKEEIDIAEYEKAIDEIDKMNKEEKIIYYQNSIYSELYSLEQGIAVLKSDYPDEYNSYKNQIEDLRKKYVLDSQESEKKLTFEIDPDDNCKKMMEVVRLKEDVRTFLEKNMKYDLICKKMQILITKLNILYNLSITHYDQRNKIAEQLKCALQSEYEVIGELQESSRILASKILKENIVDLIAYADYLILKTTVKINSADYYETIATLGIVSKFSGIKYMQRFNSFHIDEVSDYKEFLKFLEGDSVADVLKDKIEDLLRELCSKKVDEDISFNNTFVVENYIFAMLNMKNVSKEDMQIKLISKMNINVNEKEIFVSPRIMTILELTNIDSKSDFSFTLRFLNLLSDEITYKEIYFLCLLFEVLDDIKKKGLYKKIKRYEEKYGYTQNDMRFKKKEVKKIAKKDYIALFTIEKYDEEVIQDTLDKIEIDYLVQNNILFINAFYFNELDNVKRSLAENAKKFN